MGNIFNDTLLVGKIKSNYSIIEKIDEDFFGEVYKCTKIKSNDLFSIKVIKKNFFGSLYRDQCFKNIRKEIEDSQKMTNKYSLKYIDSFETADFFNIVSEYYNTTLEQYLIDRKYGLSIKEIKSLFNKLNLAFREIAVKSIIHGEINLSNIKIKYENDDIIPLISDYGQKTLLDGKLKVVNSGLNFYAPELLSGENFNYKVDLWWRSSPAVHLFSTSAGCRPAQYLPAGRLSGRSGRSGRSPTDSRRSHFLHFPQLSAEKIKRHH